MSTDDIKYVLELTADEAVLVHGALAATWFTAPNNPAKGVLDAVLQALEDAGIDEDIP